MAKDAIGKHLRIETRGHQYTVRHDKAIHQDNHAQLRSPQHTANSHHHLDTTKVAQHICRTPITLIVVDSGLQYIIFMAYASLIQSTPGTYTIHQRNARQAVHPDTGGSRVSDTHLTKANHIATLVVTIGHDVSPILDRFIHLLCRHRCLMQVVACALTHLPVNQTGIGRKVKVHATIHDLQLKAMLTSQEADTRAPIQEVVDHLPGHLFR